MDYRVFPLEGQNGHIEDGVFKSPTRKFQGPNGLIFGYSDDLGRIVSEPCDRQMVQHFIDAGGYGALRAATGEVLDWKPSDPPKTLEGLAAEARAALRAEQLKPPAGDPQAFLEEFRAKWDRAEDKSTLPTDELRRALFTLGREQHPTASKETMLAAYSAAIGEGQETGGESQTGAQGGETDILTAVKAKYEADKGSLKAGELKEALKLLGKSFPHVISTEALLAMYEEALKG